jgi:hypothetical protein
MFLACINTNVSIASETVQTSQQVDEKVYLVNEHNIKQIEKELKLKLPLDFTVIKEYKITSQPQNENNKYTRSTDKWSYNIVIVEPYVHDTAYCKKVDLLDKYNKWDFLNDSINVGLGFTKWWIWVPATYAQSVTGYTIKDLLGPSYKSSSSTATLSADFTFKMVYVANSEVADEKFLRVIVQKAQITGKMYSTVYVKETNERIVIDPPHFDKVVYSDNYQNDYKLKEICRRLYNTSLSCIYKEKVENPKIISSMDSTTLVEIRSPMLQW